MRNILKSYKDLDILAMTIHYKNELKNNVNLGLIMKTEEKSLKLLGIFLEFLRIIQGLSIRILLFSNSNKNLIYGMTSNFFLNNKNSFKI